MRVELEGIGIGFEDFEEPTDRFQRLAADPGVNLVGFSDGSLSGDGNNGGYSWIADVVENGAIPEVGVLAGGGGAALASDNTNRAVELHADGGTWACGWHVVCTQLGW
jgi:hypothetical protein